MFLIIIASSINAFAVGYYDDFDSYIAIYGDYNQNVGLLYDATAIVSAPADRIWPGTCS